MRKIAIIGAGPAGLTAAWELLRKHGGPLSVTIYEELDTVGGISRTIHHNGNRMDIGGHRFFSKNSEVMAWWKARLPIQGAPSSDDLELGREVELAPGGPDPQIQDSVMLLRNRVSHILFNRKFFAYPLSVKPVTFVNLGLMNTMLAGFSYLREKVRKRPIKNLEDFYISRFGKYVYSLFFESYTQKVWGKHPSEMSASWGSQRVRGLSITRLILDGLRKALGHKNVGNTETSLIERFWYPKFGPGQMWDTVADEVRAMGGKIVFNAKVDKVFVKDGVIAGIGYVQDRVEYKADCDTVISSMPLKDLCAALDPPAPDRMRQFAENLPYRDFITVGVLVKKLQLKNDSGIKTVGGIVPDCWIYIQEPQAVMGRLQIFNNWSPYMVKDPQNTVWIGCEYFCDEDGPLWRKTPVDMEKFTINELAELGIISRDDVLDACSEKVRKAYPAYFGSYENLPELREYFDSIKGLYCVGRNGQHRYNNMDHSMLTSIYCVGHIMNGGNKSRVWEINSEQDYHEKMTTREERK